MQRSVCSCSGLMQQCPDLRSHSSTWTTVGLYTLSSDTVWTAAYSEPKALHTANSHWTERWILFSHSRWCLWASRDTWTNSRKCAVRLIDYPLWNVRESARRTGTEGWKEQVEIKWSHYAAECYLVWRSPSLVCRWSQNRSSVKSLQLLEIPGLRSTERAARAVRYLAAKHCWRTSDRSAHPLARYGHYNNNSNNIHTHSVRSVQKVHLYVRVCIYLKRTRQFYDVCSRSQDAGGHHHPQEISHLNDFTVILFTNHCVWYFLIPRMCASDTDVTFPTVNVLRFQNQEKFVEEVVFWYL